jgi:hypothetical protein
VKKLPHYEKRVSGLKKIASLAYLEVVFKWRAKVPAPVAGWAISVHPNDLCISHSCQNFVQKQIF